MRAGKPVERENVAAWASMAVASVWIRCAVAVADELRARADELASPACKDSPMDSLRIVIPLGSGFTLTNDTDKPVLATIVGAISGEVREVVVPAHGEAAIEARLEPLQITENDLN
jgi:acetylornithine deacetylase/succinyl-diaminopimelate desuccinylase-like protein